jgi:hypothetical protein
MFNFGALDCFITCERQKAILKFEMQRRHTGFLRNTEELFGDYTQLGFAGSVDVTDRWKILRGTVCSAQSLFNIRRRC